MQIYNSIIHHLYVYFPNLDLLPSSHTWHLYPLPPPLHPPFPLATTILFSVSMSFCLFICCSQFYSPRINKITWVLTFSIWLISNFNSLLLVHRMAIYFCVLTLYHATLLLLLIGSKSFVVVFSAFLHKQSCHLWTKTVLFLPFQSKLILFLSLFGLIALARALVQYEKEWWEGTWLPCF